MILGRHSSSARRKAKLEKCSGGEYRCLCSAYEDKLCLLGFYSSRPNVRVPLWVAEQICPSCEVEKRAEREMFEADMEMDEEVLRLHCEYECMAEREYKKR